MASERAFRLLKWLAFALAAALLAAGLAASWLFGTTSGARAVLPLILKLSGAPAKVSGIDGTLAGPLQIGLLEFDQPERRVALHGIRVDWMPSELLRGRVHVASLRLERVVFASKLDSKQEPPRLPDNIALPVRVALDELQVGSGEIDIGPVNVVKIGPVSASLEFDGQRYRVGLRQLAAGSSLSGAAYATRLSGSATIAAARPYAVDGRIASSASATIEGRRIGADGEIRLGGSLAELLLDAALTVNGAKLDSKAMLMPFDAHLLRTASLQARGLDLSALDGSWPATALDADLSLDASGTGKLAMSNRAAGDLAKHALPVSRIAARFRQDGAAVVFQDIDLQFGAAGGLSGEGRYAGGTVNLQLSTGRLDLHGIDSRMRATALAGSVRLAGAAGRQDFTLNLSEPVGSQRVTLAANGSVSDDELRLVQAELRAGGGSMTGSGRVRLAAGQAFEARGQFDGFRLQDFGRFPGLPILSLNGSFTASGKRRPTLEADLDFSIQDSMLGGQPLAGAGQAKLRGEHLDVPAFNLASGPNRLAMHGRLAEGDAQLSFTLDAPQLDRLGSGFGGAVQASGSVRGTLSRPQVIAAWSANRLRAPGHIEIGSTQGRMDAVLDRSQKFFPAAASMDAAASNVRVGTAAIVDASIRADVSPAAEAPLRLTVRGSGIDAGAMRAARLAVDADGTTSCHSIRAVFEQGRQKLEMRSSGGLARKAGQFLWRGSMDSLDAGGDFRARLASPAPLEVAPGKVVLERFLLDTEGGRIAIDRLQRDADGVASRGRIERFAVAPLLASLDPPPPVRADLQLDADWDLKIGDTITGSMNLRRSSGDVTVLGPSPATLGLQSLAATVRADRGRISLQAGAKGSRLGIFDLQAALELGHGPERWKLALDSPVSGRGRVDIPSIAWIAPFLSQSMIADGRLQSDIVIGGTPQAPELSGRLSGDNLRLTLADAGIDLRQGVLQGEFNGERMQLQKLSFRGGEGEAILSGPVDLSAGALAADFALTARRFAVLNRADRRIVVSGDSRIALRDRRIKVTGAFEVDSGFVDLGRADRPQLSDDVVIVGRERRQSGKTTASVDVGIGLGNGVALKGRGLDGKLVGKLRVTGEPGERLQANGTLSVVNGTYTAYGRELKIEQGGLRFTGNIANPALDIVAMRRGQEVEAGVSVRGTVLAPRVTLVSEPTVPDAEKLSWLVLGHGLSNSGESDLGALQSAAGALLSEGAAAGVQSRLASAFGLDTISVGKSQDSLQQRIVTIGKQISSRLYVSYQQGLESAGSVVQLRYTLSQSLSLEAEAGVRSALSLFYNIAFD